MNADIRKTCARCGERFWWTVGEQEDFAQRGLRSPRRCADCRAARKMAPAEQAQALVRRAPASTAMTFPELQQPLITEDIRRLIAEASAPVEDRLRTFSEWWKDENVREKQLAKKIQAGRMANVLVKQSAEFMASVSELAKKADDFRRERLEARLAELELQDRIAERTSLRDVRLATQRAIETGRHRKLLEPETSPKSERQRVLADHRRDRQARVRAGRTMLTDFLNEVHIVCDSRASIHERALQIRNLLAAFEMDEESLPVDARWILRTAEKIRDAS